MSSSSPTYSPESFKPLLKKLVQHPTSFSAEDVAACFHHFCQSGGGGASDAQMGAFLTALTLSGLDGNPEIVAACARVLREHAVKLDGLLPTPTKGQEGKEPEGDEWDYRETDKQGEGYTGLVDIVGTGGDGSDSFNVSTTAAVVVAGTGLRVAKHGSRAATSTSGSADLLLSLGCSLTFPPSTLPALLSHSPFVFLFAPHYHPAFTHIAPVRRQLNFRTVFNVLGPLINPARPSRMVLGVARRELGDTFVEVLRMLGVQRALVVCGKEGLDEISPAGETHAWELVDGEIKTFDLHPTRDFGLPTHALSSVRGSTPELNARTFHALLTPSPSPVPPPHLASPAGPDSPSLEAIYDYVVLQSAALLRVAGRAETWKDGVQLARETIERGDALRAFEGFRKASGEAMEVGEGAVAPEDDGGVAAKGGEVMAWLKRQKRRQAGSGSGSDAEKGEDKQDEDGKGDQNDEDKGGKTDDDKSAQKEEAK